MGVLGNTRKQPLWATRTVVVLSLHWCHYGREIARRRTFALGSRHGRDGPNTRRVYAQTSCHARRRETRRGRHEFSCATCLFVAVRRNHPTQFGPVSRRHYQRIVRRLLCLSQSQVTDGFEDYRIRMLSWNGTCHLLCSGSTTDDAAIPTTNEEIIDSQDSIQTFGRFDLDSRILVQDLQTLSNRPVGSGRIHRRCGRPMYRRSQTFRSNL
mmetsp:Transcript_23859/g.41898  ORF Transcript_23859/g.41898 Transcript_23859/m.41898 type:complete len:211 (-) Transcript_23859:251-883(-)